MGKSEFGKWTACATALGQDGTVYFSGEGNNLDPTSGGVLIAYNPNDGSEKWRVGRTDKVSRGGPVIAADGTLYLAGQDGKLIVYNSADGSVKWSYDLSGASLVTPAIDNDGNIYFGDTNGIFYVLKSDGTEAYTPLDLGDKINSPAAIGTNGKIYVGATDAGVGKLYALTTTATSLASGGWPMFGRNPSHTGKQDAVLSIDRINTIEGLKIYPNPVNYDGFYTTATSNAKITVRLFDILGKEIFSKTINSNEKIETQNLKSGIYMLKAIQDNKTASSKIIIE